MRRFASLAVLLLAVFPARAGKPGDTLLLGNVAVIDGSGAPPMEDAAVLIRGDRIAAVGPAEHVSAPADARVVDGEGAFVIPGLWDMHTHVLWQPFVEDGFLRLHLVNGVTGIRDMGGTLEVLAEVRPGGRLHSPLHPRIVAAGPWLNERAIDPRAGIAVPTPDDGRRAVKELAAGGVDFIKVYSFLPRDVFQAVLQEAAAQGLPVAGHVPHGISSREASDLGLRSLEHLRVEIGGFAEEVGAKNLPALLDAFRRNGTWQTPTLVVRRNGALLDRPGHGQYPGYRHAPSYLREEWDEARRARLEREDFEAVRARRVRERELAAEIHRAGIPILAGSDAGDLYCVPGFSLHEELALLVEIGMSPAEALRAATAGAAEFLGASDSLGTIRAGKLADLVLLDANPLDDIRNTTRIRAVVRDGRLHDRPELDRILDELARAAGPTGP